MARARSEQELERGTLQGLAAHRKDCAFNEKPQEDLEQKGHAASF